MDTWNPLMMPTMGPIFLLPEAMPMHTEAAKPSMDSPSTNKNCSRICKSVSSKTRAWPPAYCRICRPSRAGAVKLTDGKNSGIIVI